MTMPVCNQNASIDKTGSTQHNACHALHTSETCGLRMRNGTRSERFREIMSKLHVPQACWGPRKRSHKRIRDQERQDSLEQDQYNLYQSQTHLEHLLIGGSDGSDVIAIHGR